MGFTKRMAKVLSSVSSKSSTTWQSSTVKKPTHSTASSPKSRESRISASCPKSPKKAATPTRARPKSISTTRMRLRKSWRKTLAPMSQVSRMGRLRDQAQERFLHRAGLALDLGHPEHAPAVHHAHVVADALDLGQGVRVEEDGPALPFQPQDDVAHFLHPQGIQARHGLV